MHSIRYGVTAAVFSLQEKQPNPKPETRNPKPETPKPRNPETREPVRPKPGETRYPRNPLEQYSSLGWEIFEFKKKEKCYHRYC